MSDEERTDLSNALRDGICKLPLVTCLEIAKAAGPDTLDSYKAKVRGDIADMMDEVDRIENLIEVQGERIASVRNASEVYARAVEEGRAENIDGFVESSKASVSTVERDYRAYRRSIRKDAASKKAEADEMHEILSKY